MTTTDFTGKVALVTGAASGIGAAVAARLEESGARVHRTDLNGAGPAGRIMTLDVREEAAWVSTIDGILKDDGHLDVLVNCAGISAASPLHETALAEWRNVLATNLDGAFLATKHGIRVMRSGGGVIIHIGSASGIRSAAGAAAYSTSKAGLHMLVRTAAKECRQAGHAIRINLVSPAGVKTPMWRSMPFFQELMQKTGSEDAAYDAMTAAGGGTFIEPGAVAEAVRFLASDAARHMTGIELPVDDGYLL